MKRAVRSTTILAVALVCGSAVAQVAPRPADKAERFLAELRRAHPGTAFDSVRPTPVAGLYEVKMGQNYAYATAGDTRYLLFGHLFDTATMRDLTPAGKDTAAAGDAPAAERVRTDELPLADAFKEVKGAGRRALYVFTDARCGYCRQLDGELAKVDNVTIHYFMVPMLDHEAPVAIWCSPDRAAAWRAVMRGAEPPKSPNCAHPIDRNAALMARLHVRGTPTMVFADGSRLESAASAELIEARLNAASRSKRDE